MFQISSSSSEGIDFSCLNQLMLKHEDHQETFCTLVKGSIKKHKMCLFLLCCITNTATKTGESEADTPWITLDLGQNAYFVVP